MSLRPSSAAGVFVVVGSGCGETVGELPPCFGVDREELAPAGATYPLDPAEDVAPGWMDASAAICPVPDDRAVS